MLPTLVGAGLSLAAKYGYDAFKRHDDKSERRDFYDYQKQSDLGYYLQSLREAPKAQREGLETAGYNPMLAIGNLASGMSGSASALGHSSGESPDVLGSVQQSAKLVNDIKHAYKLSNEKSQEEIKTIQKNRENQTLETESKLLNDAVDRELKQSQMRKTNVETITKPFDSFAGGAGAAGAAYGTTKLIQATKEAAKKLLPKLAPVAGGTAAGIGSKMLGVAGLGLPLLLGSAAGGAHYLGSKANPEYAKEVNKRMRKEISVTGLPVVY